MLHMARLCETVKIHEELFCESRRPQDAPHALSIFVPQTTQCKTCDPLSRSDQSLKLPSGNSLKALRCFKRSSKPAHVIIKLAWNLLKFDVLPPGDHIHLRAATPSRTKQRLPWEVLLSFPAWSRPSSKPVPLSSCEPKASQSASSHTTLGSFQYVYLWNHTSNRKQPKELPQQIAATEQSYVLPWSTRNSRNGGFWQHRAVALVKRIIKTNDLKCDGRTTNARR